jgi:hypothetical protein
MMMSALDGGGGEFAREHLMIARPDDLCAL